MTVRKMTHKDWQVYRDTRLRALKDSPDAFGTTWLQAEQYSDTLWQQRLTEDALQDSLPLIVTNGDDPCAMAWARVVADAEPRVIDVTQMWVQPESRGQGIAQRLLDEIILWARKQSACEVLLQVTEGNRTAEALYTTAGFQRTGRVEPLRDGSSLTTAEMKLSLASN